MSLDFDLRASFPTPAYDVPGRLRAILRARADEGRQRLADATNVDTGRARASWFVLETGALEYTLTNDAINPRSGFTYPLGLATGTGARAVGTTGFTGSHRADWKGMYPSATLHPAWEQEVRTGFALPATLFP